MVISGRSRGGDERTHNLPLTGIYKGISSHFSVNLKTCVHTQNLAFVRTYTFMIKSMESFIHEAPELDRLLTNCSPLLIPK